MVQVCTWSPWTASRLQFRLQDVRPSAHPHSAPFAKPELGNPLQLGRKSIRRGPRRENLQGGLATSAGPGGTRSDHRLFTGGLAPSGPSSDGEPDVHMVSELRAHCRDGDPTGTSGGRAAPTVSSPPDGLHLPREPDGPRETLVAYRHHMARRTAS